MKVKKLMKYVIVAALVALHSVSLLNAAEEEDANIWTFVSMPDFLNVDTVYPQPGWEDALDFVLSAAKAENPDFVLVAGDLVMGRWWSEEKIEKYAAIYYPDWIKRMNAHGLKFYETIGDHEIGDNPWPPARAKLVPTFKKAFANYIKMPVNGPEHMKGTAFHFLHKNTLFVAVDVFEKGKGPQGEIVAQVTGRQLEWFNKTPHQPRRCLPCDSHGTHSDCRAGQKTILQWPDARKRSSISFLAEHGQTKR